MAPKDSMVALDVASATRVTLIVLSSQTFSQYVIVMLGLLIGDDIDEYSTNTGLVRCWGSYDEKPPVIVHVTKNSIGTCASLLCSSFARVQVACPRCRTC